MQQENKDRRNELIVNDLEKKVKNLEDLLGENSRLEAAKANLVEALLCSKNQDIQISDQNKKFEELSEELEQVNQLLKILQPVLSVKLKN